MDKIFKIDENLFVKIQVFVHGNAWMDKPLVFLAQYLIYGIPILLIILWFWSVPVKKATFKSLLAAVIAWLGFAKIIASLVGRSRPTEALLGGKELLFHRPDTSFPSDHAAMLFALALSLRLYGMKKLGNVLLVVAALISISRVMVGVHFPLDVIGGAILGSLVAWLLWMIREYLDKYIVEPILKVLKKIKL